MILRRSEAIRLPATADEDDFSKNLRISVAMAKQYGVTGNADAVFVPYSMVLKEKGTVLKMDDGHHRPLDQSIGVLARSRNRAAAAAFAEFLANGQGHAILLKNGYQQVVGFL